MLIKCNTEAQNRTYFGQDQQPDTGMLTKA